MKGREFQKWVRDQLVEYLGIDKDEIRVTIMGEAGADVQLLTKKAKEQFDYSIECKRQEGYSKLYKDYEQAVSHKHSGTPLLVLRSNRKPALAVLAFDEFLALVKKANENK